MRDWAGKCKSHALLSRLFVFVRVRVLLLRLSFLLWPGLRGRVCLGNRPFLRNRSLLRGRAWCLRGRSRVNLRRRMDLWCGSRMYLRSRMDLWCRSRMYLRSRMDLCCRSLMYLRRRALLRGRNWMDLRCRPFGRRSGGMRL
jgi:hypothetical protein